MEEYRQDDINQGWCPKCWRELSGMTVEGKGFCVVDGWQFANYEKPNLGLCPECELAEMIEDDHVFVCPACDYETSDLKGEEEEEEDDWFEKRMDRR